MPAVDRYPLRVRLHGGRNTHGARPLDDDQITACDYFAAAGSQNHQLPADSPITCPGCLRQIARQEAR
ncbi:hypothetical protein [Streptomyces sp. NPDC048057]|uniref:hypothetical protein n=1 Tax=Streptomyces sp. NPDC048057 TaxID=3155628 RepID=UPI003404B93D